MNTPAKEHCAPPSVRPQNPQFSSGPCKKHPGWDLSKFNTENLGRSHRAADPKSSLSKAITHSADILGLPDDWQLAIVPASDTGAFEMALWSMLGQRGVDILVWESFSNGWASDIKNELKIPDVTVHKAEYGLLPDLEQVSPDRDFVFVFNGTTSGVRLANLDWIPENHEGLAFCDATSAVFAMDIDYAKLDVVTWSWQKCLGSEGGFGMLALSPKAVARLESYQAPRPLPKIFRLTKKGKLIAGLFKGATINTPSMLALEDLHSALNWAESIGGLPELIQRSQNNFNAIDTWVKKTDWVEWLPVEASTLSTSSMCLKIVSDEFTCLDEDQQRKAVSSMCSRLADNNAAFDIAAYRDAPPGFRVWGGPTVESEDIEHLLPWMDWAYQCWLNELTIAEEK